MRGVIVAYPKAYKPEADATNHLLDIVASTNRLLANPSCAAIIAPSTVALGYSDGLLVVHIGCRRFIAVNGNKMTTKIMLSTERATTGPVGTDVRFEPVRIMRLQMSLQVVSTSKS